MGTCSCQNRPPTGADVEGELGARPQEADVTALTCKDATEREAKGDVSKRASEEKRECAEFSEKASQQTTLDKWKEAFVTASEKESIMALVNLTPVNLERLTRLCQEDDAAKKTVPEAEEAATKIAEEASKKAAEEDGEEAARNPVEEEEGKRKADEAAAKKKADEDAKKKAVAKKKKGEDPKNNAEEEHRRNIKAKARAEEQNKKEEEHAEARKLLRDPGPSLCEFAASGEHVQMRSLLEVKAAPDTHSSIPLLEVKAAPDAFSSIQDQMPLQIAATKGNLKCLQLLLEFKADHNAKYKDKDRSTPLHLAAQCEYETVVQALLDAGALKGVENANGKKPLDLASTDEIRNLLKD